MEQWSENAWPGGSYTRDAHPQMRAEWESEACRMQPVMAAEAKSGGGGVCACVPVPVCHSGGWEEEGEERSASYLATVQVSLFKTPLPWFLPTPLAPDIALLLDICRSLDRPPCLRFSHAAHFLSPVTRTFLPK